MRGRTFCITELRCHDGRELAFSVGLHYQLSPMLACPSHLGASSTVDRPWALECEERGRAGAVMAWK